jgi:hypothetical protein
MSCHAPIHEITIGNLRRTWADLSSGIGFAQTGGQNPDPWWFESWLALLVGGQSPCLCKAAGLPADLNGTD